MLLCLNLTRHVKEQKPKKIVTERPKQTVHSIVQQNQLVSLPPSGPWLAFRRAGAGDPQLRSQCQRGALIMHGAASGAVLLAGRQPCQGEENSQSKLFLF